VPLFGRRRGGRGPAPGARDPSAPDRRDVATLNALIEHGADLGKPRHVLHHSYYPSREAAEAAAADAAAAGWDSRVEEPLPEHHAASGWPMVAERASATLDGAFVRESRDLFEAMAARHGGTYDGWEAGATP
jgi:hypothetical protein